MAQFAAHYQAHMLTVAVTEAGEGQVLSGSHTGYQCRTPPHCPRHVCRTERCLCSTQAMVALLCIVMGSA